MFRITKCDKNLKDGLQSVADQKVIQYTPKTFIAIANKTNMKK